jgi:hypothetical protein
MVTSLSMFSLPIIFEVLVFRISPPTYLCLREITLNTSCRAFHWLMFSAMLKTNLISSCTLLIPTPPHRKMWIGFRINFRRIRPDRIFRTIYYFVDCNKCTEEIFVYSVEKTFINLLVTLLNFSLPPLTVWNRTGQLGALFQPQ